MNKFTFLLVILMAGVLLRDLEAQTISKDAIPRSHFAKRVGNTIPTFHFTDLKDTTKIYSNDFFKGNVYLIDFWGTWCKPCIAELPYLEEAFKKYNDRGFKILSVALNDDKSSLKEFREKDYPMPWHHTLVDEEDNIRIFKLFKIPHTPFPILVDEEGKILVIDDQIKDGKLINHLSKVYNN